MAKKKPVSSSATVRARNVKIWKAAPTDGWLGFFKAHDPDKTRVWTTKGQALTCNCIELSHNDKTASMYVHPEKGFAKCFGCGYYEHDPVRFVQTLTQKSYPEAIKEIQTTFDVKIMNTAEMKVSEAEFKHADMKNKLAWILHEALVLAQGAWENRATTPLEGSEHEYAKELLEWLERRQVLKWVHALPFGILPTQMQIREIAKRNKEINGHDVAAMLKYLEAVADPFYNGSLMYIYNATPKDVSRFRLRRPGESDTKNIIMIADPREDFLGFFGLGMYNNLGAHGEKTGIGNTTTVTLVEGEFDAAMYMCQQFEQGNFDRVILAHGGATNRNVTELKNFGIKYINYVGDWDKGGEVNTKELMIESPGFIYKIFVWPDCLAVPGPESTKVDLDLALRIHGWDVVNRELDDFEKRYIKPELWCKEQIKKQIRQQGIDGDDAAIARLIFSYAPCVGDTRDEHQAAVVNKWNTDTLMEFGVGGEQAEKLANEFMARESAELVFCTQVKAKLYENFDFIAIDSSKSTMPLKMWNKKKHEMIEMRMGSDAHIKASLNVSLGTYVEWVKKELSIPDFIKLSTDKRGDPIERSLVNQEDDLLRILHLVFKDIMSKLPQVTSMETYSAGMHYLPTSSGRDNAFIVNGRRVYRGEFTKGEKPVWEELAAPIFEKYLFDTSKPAWSKCINCLEDLVRRAPLDAKALFLKIVDFLDTGWRFESQETETWAHASFIMSATILPIYKQNFQFLASNERGCGKSTLYAEAIGGGKGTEINLVEHSHFVDNTTPAGIRQSMDGSSLILIIDEFDNQKGGRYVSEKQQEVLTILRTSSGGEGKYQQGTQGGEAKMYRLSFSSMVAGIDPDITDANMTRFYTTDLKSGLDARLPPKTLILNKFTKEWIAQTREEISIDMFQFIPDLKASESFIENYCLEHPELLGAANIQRFKDTLMRLAVPMHAFGLDWIGWMKKTVVAKSKAIKTLSKLTVNESLINALLFTASIDVGTLDNRQKRMVSQFFRDARIATTRDALNASGSGVYLYSEKLSDIGEKWYLLVIWQTAVGGVLRGTSIARSKEDPVSLKVIGDRHPMALSEEQVSALVDRLPEIPEAVRDTHISVFDVSTRVEQEASKNNRFRSDGTAPKPTASVSQLRPN